MRVLHGVEGNGYTSNSRVDVLSVSQMVFSVTHTVFTPRKTSVGHQRNLGRKGSY